MRNNVLYTMDKYQFLQILRSNTKKINTKVCTYTNAYRLILRHIEGICKNA